MAGSTERRQDSQEMRGTQLSQVVVAGGDAPRRASEPFSNERCFWGDGAINTMLAIITELDVVSLLDSK